MKAIVIIGGVLIISGVFFVIKMSDLQKPPAEEPKTENFQKSYFGNTIIPIPEPTGLNEKKVALGEKLFHDPLLSGDKSISCASCHILPAGGDSNMAGTIGVGQVHTKINTPTVFNSSLNFKQFWDGRADTLEDQVDGPITNPNEMNSSWETVLSRLKASDTYSTLFNHNFADGITKENIKTAIAEFQRSLLTPNSPFDKFLKGDENALTQDEKEGYKLFDKLGCIRCHQGIGIGGNMFQRMGAKRNYFKEDDELALGRYRVTKKEVDKFRFKVPSLRNVAMTAPYFHDGSAATLEDAVSTMAKYQLARRLKPDEMNNIIAFLKSLTGEYKGKSLASYTE